jgi:hypothetical protein
MYKWIDAGDGRSVYRKVSSQDRQRSDLPCPMVISDHIEPVQSMADGNYYSSKSSLRKTYKPSGNPEGASYVELGNEKVSAPPAAKQVGSIKESIMKAKQRVGL